MPRCFFRWSKTRRTVPFVQRFIRKVRKSFSFGKKKVSSVFLDSREEWTVSISTSKNNWQYFWSVIEYLQRKGNVVKQTVGLNSAISKKQHYLGTGGCFFDAFLSFHCCMRSIILTIVLIVVMTRPAIFRMYSNIFKCLSYVFLIASPP